VLLDELELLAGVRPELQRRRDGQDQGQAGHAEGDVLGPVGQTSREGEDDDSADKRQQRDRRQPGKVRHYWITHTAAKMATTPASIVRA
jgi:hypothetical protein